MSPEKENEVYMIFFAILTVYFLVVFAGLLYLFVTGVSAVNILDLVLTLVAASASATAFCMSWAEDKALKKEKKAKDG